MKQKTKKIAAYTLSGVTFLGAVTGLLVNMTRLGDSFNDEASSGVIQIMPTLIQEAPPISDMLDAEMQHSVHYKVDQTGADIKINYASSAFDGPLKSVGMLGEGPFFALPKIGIDIKLVNNTDEAIFVTDAIIKVAKSQLNLDPLLISIQHDGIVGYLTWLNDGWAEPDSISVSARMSGTDLKMVELPVSSGPDALIDATLYNFDIAPVLSELGIDSESYRAARTSFELGDSDLDVWQDIKTSCIRAVGDLSGVAEFLELITGEAVDPSEITDPQIASSPVSCSIQLEGILKTNWIDEGAQKSREQPFVLTVMVTPPDGLGAAGFAPTGAYDVKLRDEGSAYTISVPISQPVAPAGFDRFVLWVGADKSSFHDLAVTLNYNQDGEITSQPIQIDYLRPRSTAGSASSNP